MEMKGVFLFNSELKSKELAVLKSLLLDEEIYEFEINEEFDGIVPLVNDTYYNQEVVFFLQDVMNKMRLIKKDFCFKGELTLIGYSIEDEWKIFVEGDQVKQIKVKKEGEKITCPYCEAEFYLNEIEEIRKENEPIL